MTAMTARPNPDQCPAHIRIISAKSSEGFSPWYLLLGATSSASGLLNLLIVQWPILQCCRVVSSGRCFASLLGFIQVALQWSLFTIILVLYLIYFPAHLKYERVLPLPSTSHYGADESNAPVRAGASAAPAAAKIATTPEWRLAVALAWVVALHLGLLLLLELALLLTLPTQTPPHPLLRYLATFLGLSGTALAVLQYAPQIAKTYRARLVGALSLGTMAIQVPGSVAFVVSLLVREGTNWTSWLPYAVTGAMQGVLLVICIAWRRRQAKLGIDDFGNSPAEVENAANEHTALVD
ncbi:hypothetical protein Q5752_004265 [Cryptotrichosporon argae]